MVYTNATAIVTKTSTVLTSISASLSMVGAIIIIATYIAWPEIRSSPRKVLVYISIADFFTAFGNMFSVLKDSKGTQQQLCEAQSFITTCSSLWSFFWTTFLAVYLYCSVALRKPYLANRLLLFFTLFGWVIPLIITGVALGSGVLGNDDNYYSAGWCWIRTKGMSSTKRLLWMLFTGKAWEIATYILITVFYIALKCYIHKDITSGGGHFDSNTSIQSAIRAERKLIMIPLIFIFLRIWGTLRFILLQTLHPSQFKKIHFLVYLHGIGDSAQGFANFLLFCFFTEKFQRKLAAFLCSCWKWKSLPADGMCQPDQMHKDKGYSDLRNVDENSPLLDT